MSEKTSRMIFIGEYALIFIPMFILLLVNTFGLIYTVVVFFSLLSRIWIWIEIINILFGVIACISLFSGFVISRRFLIGSSEGIESVEPKWWLLCIPGIVLVAVSGIVSLFPISSENLHVISFLSSFKLFSKGFLLFIPIAHVLLEKYLRKPIME